MSCMKSVTITVFDKTLLKIGTPIRVTYPPEVKKEPDVGLILSCSGEQLRYMTMANFRDTTCISLDADKVSSGIVSIEVGKFE